MARRAAPAAMPLPADVRWMNAVAAVLLTAVALAAGVGVVAWMARQPMWTLRGITLVGDVAHQNAVTVRALVVPHLRGTFLTLDLAAARERFEALPWVREAVVERQFPNRLRVTLREHEALAWWGEPGAGQLVSVRGEVFEADPDDPAADQWSTLAGPSAEAETVVAMYRRLQPLVARLGRDIERLTLTERGAWQLRLDGGAPIELGRGEADAVERLQRFVTTQTALRARYGARDIVSADLRYPNGYALQLRGVTTEPVPVRPKGAMPAAIPSPNPLSR
ncbi:cell division protein FtsQ/DivIB [Tepidimonas taiwanensis]|uniref:Cell division protein FtsQ n=1 Tax=Tepidimonas taiwanensis TaxID=307486 RepID=A0A554XDS5_9BURK|nr:cell division protein FtsQ/DivIB [Tepidimonas taiwanensis]MCX7693802.1 cell division protein FtsQ/DivIB [Tepidimonas taiwanensis]MDM7462499.1 cell division protein FtsQ/DivIB [Tepidimonas taiwanensis]TSE33985.1 Cell division protein FtsQ [Tepidimonas taiwanensis]UBQ05036.1 cell division protein FtsQ/DivIB [Tepidimonas taiwanensis]